MKLFANAAMISCVISHLVNERTRGLDMVEELFPQEMQVASSSGHPTFPYSKH